MDKLKERWDIEQNWQLLFPALGITVLAYSSYKLSYLFLKEFNMAFNIFLSAVIFFLLLKFTLFIFNKLENKWEVNYKWEMISIFLVFAVTGSSSLFISRPIIKFIGITKENLNPFLYWVLYIIIGFIFYQILLVLIGWLFGQFKFFWNFEKKMLRRIGLKRLID
ncbi:hypothetical protein EV196_102594 [Mariniflexile fucanivorans]|uniref:DUF6787 domain-containing protein n=1 Tax=Mariniflexile fucanivorans TaxID=264023 RepID=A0A4R1RQ18_9FLAO|nr:DUF6787 family protein [Mariniflexile fucanivorans]TCL68030.1 hypothetical protein EV196_102594 [Mariniflexile fucanivorans]